MQTVMFTGYKKRIFSWQSCSHSVISIAPAWMEVENKKQICSLKSDDLIAFMLFTHIGLQELTRITFQLHLDAATTKLFTRKTPFLSL